MDRRPKQLAVNWAGDNDSLAKEYNCSVLAGQKCEHLNSLKGSHFGGDRTNETERAGRVETHEP